MKESVSLVFVVLLLVSCLFITVVSVLLCLFVVVVVVSLLNIA